MSYDIFLLHVILDKYYIRLIMHADTSLIDWFTTYEQYFICLHNVHVRSR